jgi:hypothetical protein
MSNAASPGNCWLLLLPFPRCRFYRVKAKCSIPDDTIKIMLTRTVFILFTLTRCVPLMGQDHTYRSVLGENRVKALVRSATERHEIPARYVDQIAERIYEVRSSPEKPEAERTLQRGVDAFAVGFARARRRVIDTEVTVDTYLAESTKCGVIPCNKSKCCKDCSPPPCDRAALDSEPRNRNVPVVVCYSDLRYSGSRLE